MEFENEISSSPSSFHAGTERKGEIIDWFLLQCVSLSRNFEKWWQTFFARSENNMRSSHETFFFFHGKRWNFHLFVLRPLRSFDCNKKNLIFKLIITQLGSRQLLFYVVLNTEKYIDWFLSWLCDTFWAFQLEILLGFSCIATFLASKSTPRQIDVELGHMEHKRVFFFEKLCFKISWGFRFNRLWSKSFFQARKKIRNIWDDGNKNVLR